LSSFPGKKKKKASAPAAKAVEKIVIVDETEIPLPSDEDLVKLQEKSDQREWGRNPFLLAKAKKVYKAEVVVLKGVSLGKEGKNFAFINDQIVSIGDKVKEHTVIEIHKDKVLLKKGNDSFYLGLPEQ